MIEPGFILFFCSVCFTAVRAFAIRYFYPLDVS